VPRTLVLVALLLGCHHRTPPRPAPTTGGIGGIVRDRVTGEPVEAVLAAHGADSLDVHGARTGADGSYRIEGLPPGPYNLVATIPGTSMQFTDIPVVAGRVTGFDIPVDPAMVEVEPQSFQAIETDEIRLYQPDGLDPATARLEGLVTDVVTRERVGSVVIVATSPSAPEVLTSVSDDLGRFSLGLVPAGIYDLSAFYQVARRGQIEVKRSAVKVPVGYAVYVPMYVELSGSE
jgi:hypothetical protein